jgi:ceramide glucosyltransferase
MQGFTEIGRWVPIVVAAATGVLGFAGLAYYAAALWAARGYSRAVRRVKAQADEAAAAGFSPAVSVMKPLRGVDDGMYEALASHCRQEYSGEWELIFGAAPEDAAVKAAIARLQAEFPAVAIKLVECPLLLGPNGKVSTLVQMLPSARHGNILINDSDIFVSPRYLVQTMAGFSEPGVGMVTAIYYGRCIPDARGRIPVWAKLEALTVSTDFVPGALLAMQLEGGVKFALGGTLAVKREALDAIGGLAPLVDYLADDYQLGVSVIKAGYRIVMSPEVVATGVPPYRRHAYVAHQLRWLRTVREERKAGYIGYVTTFGLVWATAAVIASAGAMWSWALLSLTLATRLGLALAVGVGILGDTQVIRDLWLVPLRDFAGAALWVASFAGDVVEWRGIKFRLVKGKLVRA